MAVTMRYRLEFYEGSIQPDSLVFSVEPATVPFSFSVGDFVDPSGWSGNVLKPEEHYEITAVEHQFTYPGHQECQHNIVISVRAVVRSVE